MVLVSPSLPQDDPGASRSSSRWSWCGLEVVWSPCPRRWQVFLFTFMNPVQQGLTCDWRSCCLCSGTALKTDTPGVWGTRGHWYWRTGRASPSRRHMLEITSQTWECFLGSLKCWTFGRSSSDLFSSVRHSDVSPRCCTEYKYYKTQALTEQFLSWSGKTLLLTMCIIVLYLLVRPRFIWHCIYLCLYLISDQSHHWFMILNGFSRFSSWPDFVSRSLGPGHTKGRSSWPDVTLGVMTHGVTSSVILILYTRGHMIRTMKQIHFFSRKQTKTLNVNLLLTISLCLIVPAERCLPSEPRGVTGSLVVSVHWLRR